MASVDKNVFNTDGFTMAKAVRDGAPRHAYKHETSLRGEREGGGPTDIELSKKMPCLHNDTTARQFCIRGLLLGY